MDLIARLRRLFSRSPVEPNTDQTTRGGFVHSQAGAIHDGMSYSLPVIVTRDMRAHMDPAALDAYIQESTLAAQSFRFQFDTPQRGGSDLPVSPVTEDPLMEWSHSTRQQVLSSCHAAYDRNPNAFRGLKYYAAFVVGEGFNLVCKNKDVERVLDAFIDNPENAIRGNEQQFVIDLLTDGELFERFFEGEGETAGQVVMVPLRPWEIDYIRTEKGFFRRVTSYHMQRYEREGDAPDGDQDTTEENVPADEVLHVAINRRRYELRGRPELYAALPWLRAHKEWLENRARQNYWRGALLWWIKVMNATGPVIAAVLSRWSRPPTPGSVAVESSNVEVQALTNPVGAGDAGEDGRQLRIMAATAMGLPEYFLGDGENANLATTKSQQLPALTTFGQMQQLMVEQFWYPIFQRVLQAAIDAGELPDEVEEQDVDGDPLYEDPDPEAPAPMPMMPTEPTDTPTDEPTAPMLPAAPAPQKKRTVATLDAFDVSYAPIGDKEPFTLAQSLKIAVDNEWLSNEDASRELGYDPDIQRKKIARERNRERDEVAQGLRPPPFNPADAMAGDNGNPFGGDT